MYNFPERKKYRYIIPTIKGDLILRFEQATAQETMDFYNIMWAISKWDIEEKIENIVSINKYFRNFIKKHSSHRWINLKERRKISLVLDNMDLYINDIISAIHPLWDSVYKDKELPKIKWKKNRTSLFPNDRESIYKKTGIPTDKIYDTLTMEQIWWYIDKIVYDVYETFPEGQAINDTIGKKAWLSEEDKQLLEFIKSQKR
jgi:hypothetical protein